MRGGYSWERAWLTNVAFFDPVLEGLRLVENRMRIQADGYHPELNAALNHLLASGGKRIRVAVTLLIGGMLGAAPDRLVTLAAAIEMLHTATLVHDDLIDGALMRRGTPTLNAQWSPAATVLTGDFIFARAAKLAAETDSVEVMRLFADTLAVIVGGEITQMFGRQAMKTRENYDRRIYAKTASLFETAAASAAILSQSDPEQALHVKQFGYEIGMAFQIVDDILDFTGEQATVGKPVASDLRQGLITLPVLYYLDLNNDDPVIHSILERNPVSETQIQQLVTEIKSCGAIERSMDEARKYVGRGIGALCNFGPSLERTSLEDLARFIVSRSS
jgi:geranylgeranyl pyrophosphate synthase